MPTLLDVMAEAFRLRLVGGVEEWLALEGFTLVAGVDEAGRGPLAGPVVAGACIPDPRRPVPGVDDSKHLSPEVRDRLAAEIRRTSLAWAVSAVSPAVIDRINVLEATRRAMRRAVEALDPAPELVLVDAVPLAGLACPMLPLVSGDSLCHAVSCASILAKVERDRRMCELDAEYPHYGFAAHKGYAAPRHLAALARHGPSPVHRLTFGSVVPRRGREVS